MFEWVPADTVAEALSVTSRAVRSRARRNSWRTREVPNPGGGRAKLEYCVDDLPEEARAELARRQVAEVQAAHPEAVLARQAEADDDGRGREAGAAALARLTPEERAEVEAKVWVCEAFARFAEAAGCGVTKARTRFARLYKAGDVEAPASVRAAVPKLSAKSIQRWTKTLAGEGPAGFIPAYGARSARAYEAAISEDNELGALVLGYLLEKGRHATGYLIRERALEYLTQGRFVATDSVPHVRTFERYLQWLREERPQTYWPLVDPAKARGRLMPAFGDAAGDVVRLNQRWELDSTIADVQLVDADGALRRFALVACVDVFSRRARVLVTRTSRSVAIAAVLRRCILEWGVPETLKLDNGKDYTSTHVAQIARQLQVATEFCRPFAPWEKPHVERFFRTLQGQALVPLPGYTGANVSERQALRERHAKTASGGPMLPRDLGAVALSPEELQTHLDRWVATVYSHRGHDGVDDASPFERAMASPVPARRLGDERALDVLLAKPAGARGGLFKVGKKGVQYQPRMFEGTGRTFHFWDRGLVGGHMDTRVICRESETDLGRLWVFTQGGEFICEAVCPDLLGHSAEETRRRLDQAKQTYRKHQAEVVKRARRATDEAAAADVVGTYRAERTGADRVAGQIAPSVPHETEGIRQATRATRPKPTAPTNPTADDLAAVAAMQAGAEARRAAEEAAAQAAAEAAAREAAPVHALRPRRLYASDVERYDELAERLGCGEVLSPDERAWFADFEQRAAGGGPARTG